MKKNFTLFGFILMLSFSIHAQSYDAAKENPRQKTTFQTAHAWIPEIDVRSDAAIVYGVSERGQETFEDRVKSWRDKGYQTDFMTGIAWGQYFDYFLGKWDGKNHLGVGQVTIKGDTIMH